MEQFGIYVARSGECVGNLRSLPVAHKIAHQFLAAWPELAQLTLVDSVHWDTWTVEPGECGPLSCDVALSRAPHGEWRHTGRGGPTDGREARRGIDEGRAEHARGESPAGDETRPFPGPPPVLRFTKSGLPVRVPVALPARSVHPVIDPVLLRRVVDRLRRL
jgi:hypothetical protein